MEEIIETMQAFARGAAAARDEWDWEPALVRGQAADLVADSSWRTLEPGEQGFIWQVMEFDRVDSIDMLRRF